MWRILRAPLGKEEDQPDTTGGLVVYCTFLFQVAMIWLLQCCKPPAGLHYFWTRDGIVWTHTLLYPWTQLSYSQMMIGASFITSETLVFRFHETILRFSEPIGSLEKKGWFHRFCWRPTCSKKTRWRSPPLSGVLKGHNTSRWWCQTFFIFNPDLGKWSNLTNVSQMGWNHQLEFYFHCLYCQV